MFPLALRKMNWNMLRIYYVWTIGILIKMLIRLRIVFIIRLKMRAGLLGSIRKGKSMRHVQMHCENHPDRTYTCKSIAISDNGRYNASRNLFMGNWYYEGIPECDCPGSALIVSNFEDLAKARLEE